MKYEITVSYLGIVEEILFSHPNSALIGYDFIPEPAVDGFKEIVIKYEFKPLVIKKITYILR